MSINVIEEVLLKILENIEFLEEQIEDTMTNFYTLFPVRTNEILKFLF